MSGSDGGGGGGRLRWGGNETRRAEDVDAQIELKHGGYGSDDDDGGGGGGECKPNCRGGHGLRSYNAPNDSLKCDECAKRMSKGSEFYG